MFDKRQPTEYNLHLNSGNFLFPQSQRKFLKKRHRKKNIGSNTFVLFLPRISSKGAFIICPSRDLAQKAKSQESTLVNTYSWNNYTVNIPEKILICLNRGRMDLLGNDDVSIVCAHK